ncbi:Hypothetical protein SRAE_0000065800 [Strongyloides ratti]|uniref:HTH_48 domain-containing protein n=1 Tax=Strongyloides ratti TaxID=34506 RepID=A0A090KVT9_STRRB|nr:Hypothetical protein SRAE_0000065800 [Strongyloides ratti]CEF61536.1 Hypothetical protein SRAE_0000065800 [Strongyloides ratti]
MLCTSEIRTIFLYEFKKGTSASKTARNINEAFGKKLNIKLKMYVRCPKCFYFCDSENSVKVHVENFELHFFQHHHSKCRRLKKNLCIEDSCIEYRDQWLAFYENI